MLVFCSKHFLCTGLTRYDTTLQMTEKRMVQFTVHSVCTILYGTDAIVPTARAARNNRRRRVVVDRCF
jgi:hypothetical protein